MTVTLRPYQEAALEALRGGLSQGRRRQVLCLPTGAGKTEVAMAMIALAREKGRRAVFLCDRISLIEQTSQRFWAADIPHGMMQSDRTWRREEPIQVCSAQTVEARKQWPDMDLLIVDEAHVMRKFVTRAIPLMPHAVIGLTATPFTKALGKVYDGGVVNAVTTNTLLKDGYLAPLRVMRAVEIDTTGAATVGGEWTDAEMEPRAGKIVGDIVSEWIVRTRQVFDGPVKTLLFGPTVAFCEEICRQFQEKGYDFRTSSYRDSADKSSRMVEGFRKGEFIGLASCEKFVRGFDVPDVKCLVAARPYRKSFTAHIQQLGRAMRVAPGKDQALILDHSGNYAGWYDRMQMFFERGCPRLDDGKQRTRTPVRAQVKRGEMDCPSCGYVMKPIVSPCPACGRVIVRKSDVAVIAGTMIEDAPVTGEARGAWKRDHEWTWTHICRVASNRHDDDERARKFALAQYRNLYHSWPDTEFARDDGVPDNRVEQAVRYRFLKWARARSA